MVVEGTVAILALWVRLQNCTPCTKRLLSNNLEN